MSELALLIVGALGFGIGWPMYKRKRERDLMERLKRIGNDPAAAMGALDQEIAHEKAVAEFWKKDPFGF